jgi:hypothetical protein
VADGTIEVVASHPAVAFFYSTMRANIEVDGNLSKHDWGSHSFRVAPGTHEVAVSYPWLFMRRCGRSKVEVDVGSEETVRVTYLAHVIRYVPGKMTTEKVSSPRQ